VTIHRPSGHAPNPANQPGEGGGRKGRVQRESQERAKAQRIQLTPK